MKVIGSPLLLCHYLFIFLNFGSNIADFCSRLQIINLNLKKLRPWILPSTCGLAVQFGILRKNGAHQQDKEINAKWSLWLNLLRLLLEWTGTEQAARSCSCPSQCHSTFRMIVASFTCFALVFQQTDQSLFILCIRRPEGHYLWSWFFLRCSFNWLRWNYKPPSTVWCLWGIAWSKTWNS